MSREDYISDAYDILRDIIQQDGEVELTEGEHRFSEISSFGTDEYPILVGAIATYYIDPSKQPEHVDLDNNYSEDWWERMIHRSLMETVRRTQLEKSDPSDTSQETPSSEQYNLDGLEDLAGVASDEDSTTGEEAEEQEFAEMNDGAIVSIFQNAIEREIEAVSNKEYEVYFPLNIGQSGQDTFLVSGTQIHRVANSEISDVYTENDPEEVNISGTELQRYLDRFDLDPESRDQERYWSCSINARSATDAISNFTNHISKLLGKINFALYYDSDVLDEHTLEDLLSNQVLDEQIIVELPPFVIVCNNNQVESAESLNDRNGDPVDLDRSFEETYDDLGLRKFPKSYARDSEETLASGLHGFFSGISATESSNSFFGFWRGLEDISFTDPRDDNSIDTLLRTGSFSSNEEVSDMFDRLMNTRNRMVHTGNRPTVLARDIIVLRELFLEAFPEIIDIENSAAKEDTETRYVIKYISQDSDFDTNHSSIDKKLSEYQSQKRALRAAENWQDSS